jgi:hypothetical protein
MLKMNVEKMMEQAMMMPISSDLFMVPSDQAVVIVVVKYELQLIVLADDGVDKVENEECGCDPDEEGEDPDNMAQFWEEPEICKNKKGDLDTEESAQQEDIETYPFHDIS